MAKGQFLTPYQRGFRSGVWFLGNAEAMLALRRFALSEDGRWDEYFEGLEARRGRARGRGSAVPSRCLRPEERRADPVHRPAREEIKVCKTGKVPAHPHIERPSSLMNLI